MPQHATGPQYDEQRNHSVAPILSQQYEIAHEVRNATFSEGWKRNPQCKPGPTNTTVSEVETAAKRYFPAFQTAIVADLPPVDSDLLRRQQ